MNKTSKSEILDVDDASRRVKVAINKVGVKDLDNDVIEAKAFDKTIKERGPQGSNLVWHLVDHEASLKSAIAKPTEIGVENGYLYFVSNILKTGLGNDVLEHYAAGTINQHSIGFRTMKSNEEKDSDGTYTLIKEVKLFEGSAVLWGANPFTPTFSVGKSLTKEEAANELDTLFKEYEKFATLLRKGNLTDEGAELLEIRVAQMNEKMKSLFNLATQPVVETVEPEVKKDESLIGLTNFINSLKQQK